MAPRLSFDFKKLLPKVIWMFSMEKDACLKYVPVSSPSGTNFVQQRKLNFFFFFSKVNSPILISVPNYLPINFHFQISTLVKFTTQILSNQAMV